MYTTAADAKNMIIEVIESGAATSEEFDIDQIFDTTFEWDGKGFSQIVDADGFWAAVEKAVIGDEG